MLQSLIGPVSGLLDKFVPDAGERARLAHEIATMSERHAQERALAQMAVNRAEAGHRSLMVAGWRPFIGWVCGAALAWHFIGAPIALFFIAVAGAAIPPLPAFDMSELMTVLLGLLGLGGLRTLEKVKGAAK